MTGEATADMRYPLRNRLREQAELSSTPKHIIVDRASPVLHKEMDMKLDSDKFDPEISCIQVLNIRSVTTVVAVDNPHLKSLCYLEGVCHSYWVDLGAFAAGLTKFREDTVAVTLPAVKKLKLFKVTPALLEDMLIQVGKQYHGIASLNDSTLVTSAHLPPCVDLMDLEGTVLKSFTSTPSIEKPFDTPDHIHVNADGNIVVSDQRTSYITCMSPAGDLIFSYYTKKIFGPGCVTSTETGDILYIHESKLLHLSADGHYVREVLTPEDVRGIADVCFEGGLLYVATRWDGVKIFK